MARRSTIGLRTVVAIALLAAATATAAGCGVPRDHKPQALALADLPPALAPDAGQATTTTTAGALQVDVVIFLARQDRTVRVVRTLATPVAVEDRLRALLSGPTDAERATGIRTAIAPDATVLHATVTGGVADVDLSSSFVDLTGQEQILAVAQVVFTATETPGVSGVRFELAGERVAVPTGDGTLTDGPLTRSNFEALQPA